ncbi:MAG: hypothetical protein ACI8U3_001808 [Brevundimonas sp.]|jgi:hypothetical protein|uniref:DUF5694 domain-containing protein n=1 Tax=Brevundimonas sp. TaxID=1871086 RepID=UPI0039E2E00C
MFRLAAVVLALLAPAGAMAQQTSPSQGEPPVEVLFLGTYHFANPGIDQHNPASDSVLTPRRQAELERVAAALAEFQPTHVMVEMVAPAPDYRIAAYERFDPASLLSETNEIDQIGFRLAHRLGLAHVHGIDVQPAEGEESHFPIDRVRAAAERSGQTDILAALNEDVGNWVEAFDAAQADRSIAESLLAFNQPDFPGGQVYYDRMLPIAHGDDLAGAHLNARIYARNIAIFAKLTRIVEPGDRVVVVYGAGHGAWLRHFARSIDGYRDVDVRPYLERAR